MTETLAIACKPSMRIRYRRLVTWAVIVACFSLFGNFVLGFPIALSMSLVAQIGLFFLLFDRPVWAIASITVGQLTTAVYLLPLGGTEISVRFIWTVMACLVLVPVLRRRGGLELGPRVRRILIPAVIFFGWSSMTMLINTGLSQTVEYLRATITALTIITLVPAAIKNEKDLKLLGLAALITSVISAVFALAQHFNTLGYPIPAYALLDNAIMPGRTSGLSETPVAAGFNLPVIIMPTLAVFFLNGVKLKTKKVLLVLSLIMIWGLYVTFTRTGIYSLLPGLLLALFLVKSRYKKQIVLITLVLIIAFVFYVANSENRYSQGFTEETSAAGRLVLWQAGLLITQDNMLIGIGQANFVEESEKYAYKINPAVMDNLRALMGRDVQGLGYTEAHNDFITVSAAYGLIALLAYLWIFVSIFRNFIESCRMSSSPFLKSLSIGCIGAILSYMVNAFTHNVMDSSQLLWIFAGLSLAITKLTLDKRQAAVKESL